jgi:hypothetical protein
MFPRGILLVLLLLAACTGWGSSSPPVSRFEVTGSTSDRLIAVSEIIGAHQAVPSGLQDAYFLEEKNW